MKWDGTGILRSSVAGWDGKTRNRTGKWEGTGREIVFISHGMGRRQESSETRTGLMNGVL